MSLISKITSMNHLRTCYSAQRLTLATLVVSIACSAAVAAETSQQVEKFPDGKTKATYSLNEEGVRDGVYKEFYEDGALKVQGIYRKGKLEGLTKEQYPSGKLKQKRTYKKGVLSGKYSEHDEKGIPTLTAVYRDGKLHGLKKQLEGRKSISEEIWADGKLLLPKSPALLKKQLKAISKAKIETVGEMPETLDAVVNKVNDASAHELRVSAMRLLMMYRAACNLPYEDMVLDRTCIAHAEAAGMVLAKLGKPSHVPPNPGVSEELYQFGLVGTKHSNLRHGADDATISSSVRDYMWDTDHPANVVRLGHRRWCLNPEMRKSGFGKTVVDQYSSMLTMWAFDNSRKEFPDYDFFAFPARGVQPISLMFPKKPCAWSTSFNPAKYRMPSDSELGVKVVAARFDPKKLRLVLDDKPYELEQVHVSIEQYSYPPAVIFQPKDPEYRPGKSYWVEITGVKNADGTSAEIGYLVSFAKF